MVAWLSRLDAVAISHAHADHMGGVHSVIDNFHPRELWLGTMAGELSVASGTRRAEAAAARAFRGDRMDFGEASVEVVAPRKDWEFGRKARNDDSLVLRVSYPGHSALLAGDAERKLERELASANIRADVLRVPHHGSARSTSPELLARVSPQFAVISDGYRNGFQYPRPEVLARLERAHVATYRTDEHGAVTFYLDAGGVAVTLPNRP